MTQKTKQTHGVKKDFPAQNATSELLATSSENDLLFGPGGINSARPDFLEKLTTLKEPALRHMAAEGFFPAPSRRRFNLTATITGVIRCLITRAERKTAKELPDLPSMDAAEGSGLFTKKFLQTLKSAGCPGFHPSGRIELSHLLPGIEAWLAGDNQRDKLELQREGVPTYSVMREKYQALNEKLKHGELNGSLMDSDTAIATGLAAQSIYFAMLDRLGVDFPGRLAGRHAAEIKTEVDKALKKIRHAVQKEFATRRQTTERQLAAQREQDELVKVP